MVDTSKFKLGKLPPRRSLKVPAFRDFLSKRSEWPEVKPRGWEYAVPPHEVEMLGNDKWGDCAQAGAMHLIQTETYNSGHYLHGTEEQTLRLYSAVTGFDPKAGAPDENPTDQGTVLLDLLRYWRDEGIEVTDRLGRIVKHRILGWAALDITSVAQHRYALDVFGGTYLGIQCPRSAMEDTSNWKYSPESFIEGGHCINGEGQGHDGGHVKSWGKSIPHTWEFMHHYLDEGYVVISEFWLDRQGKTPSGLDLDGLLKVMKKL